MRQSSVCHNIYLTLTIRIRMCVFVGVTLHWEAHTERESYTSIHAHAHAYVYMHCWDTAVVAVFVVFVVCQIISSNIHVSSVFELNVLIFLKPHVSHTTHGRFAYSFSPIRIYCIKNRTFSLHVPFFSFTNSLRWLLLCFVLNLSISSIHGHAHIQIQTRSKQ